jgi:hypothetical protein
MRSSQNSLSQSAANGKEVFKVPESVGNLQQSQEIVQLRQEPVDIQFWKKRYVQDMVYKQMELNQY